MDINVGQQAGTDSPAVDADEVLKPDQDLLALLGQDDDSVTPELPGQELGVVRVDTTTRKVRIPTIKIRQDNSVGVDPNIPVGAVLLGSDIMVSRGKGPNNFQQCNIVILHYDQGYEDNVSMGYRGPKNWYKDLDAILATPKTGHGFDPKINVRNLPAKYAKLYEPFFKAATVREAARMVLLLEQPEGVDAPTVFQYEHEGKRYALARWFMNGHAVWTAGKAIVDTAPVWKTVGIVSCKWLLWTQVEDSRQEIGKKFAKPYLRLLRDAQTFNPIVNSKTFLENVVKWVPNSRQLAAKESDPAPSTPPAAQ